MQGFVVITDNGDLSDNITLPGKVYYDIVIHGLDLPTAKEYVLGPDDDNPYFDGYALPDHKLCRIITDGEQWQWVGPGRPEYKILTPDGPAIRYGIAPDGTYYRSWALHDSDSPLCPPQSEIIDIIRKYTTKMMA